MLLDLQQRFLQALLSPHLSDSFPLEPLQIYHANYTGALYATLEEMYPVCKKIVGEKYFKFATNEYITVNRSFSYSLNDYGANFADFVSTLPSAMHLAYLPDVIRLEYLIHESTLGYDARVFNFNEFYKVPAKLHSELKFRLLENGYLLESSFPVDDIWHFNQAHEYRENNDKTSELLSIERAKKFFFVYYIDAKLHINRILREEYLFLQELKLNKTLNDVCENLLNKNVAEDTIAKLLPTFLKRKYIDSFSY